MKRAVIVGCLACVVIGCRSRAPGAGSRGDSSAAHVAPPKAVAVAKKRGSELVPVPDALAGTVVLRRVVRGLKRPVALEHIPGDTTRVFVVEQRGTVVAVSTMNFAVTRPAVLDIRKLVSRRGEEQGLLGLAFHPDFSSNRRLYVNYTDKRGATKVVEYTMNSSATAVVSDSAREIFTVAQPYTNHNGGAIEFGPDGMLYIGTGDGGSAGDPAGAGQDRNNLLAKMLVIDVNSRMLEPTQVHYGLRNPWRYHFDSKTGDLYIADVGQDKWEEINVVAARDNGSHNFGWNLMEGTHCFGRAGCDARAFTGPVIEYDHDTGCSVTGGIVYRGSAIPGLDGAYFYADYCTAIVRSFRWQSGAVSDHWNWKPVLDHKFKLAQLSAFGTDAGGEMYLLSLEGTVYKLVPKP